MSCPLVLRGKANGPRVDQGLEETTREQVTR